MSRKARISEEKKKEWACVRAWTATKGYSAYKPPDDGYLRNPLIVLEHDCQAGHPMRSLSGVAQELLFAETISTVLVIDFTALLILRDSDEKDFDILGDQN